MFEKFHRVEDPMTMTTGGTGLGLYIARELTRAMGGEIGRPAPPAGLDLHRPAADGPQPRGRRGRRGARPRPGRRHPAPRTKARRLP